MDVEAGAHNVAGLVMPKTSARPKSAAPDGAGAKTRAGTGPRHRRSFRTGQFLALAALLTPRANGGSPRASFWRLHLLEESVFPGTREAGANTPVPYFSITRVFML